MTQRGAKIGLFLAAVVALLTGVFAQSAGADAAPGAISADAAKGALTGRVVIIGIPGLMWSDVDERTTPTLWGLTGRGAAAGLSVRTTRNNTCPTDGWLTLSAGQRARLAHGDCALPSSPIVPGQPSPTGQPPAGGAIASGWPAVKSDNAETSYHAQAGLLGDAVHKAGGCTLAVGPGAVFGLADGGGRVDRYIASPDKATTADWARCQIAAVDVDEMFRAYLNAGVDPHGDQIPLNARKRASAASAVDRRVGQVLSGIPAGTTVLVAALSDTSFTPHLRLAAAAGGGFRAGFLTSSATRRLGLVTLTDLTSTSLKVLGLPQPEEAVGSPWRSEASRASTRHRVDALVDEDVAAQAIRSVQGSFYSVLFVTQLILWGIAALVLRRFGSDPTSRARILGVTRIVALLGGAAPGASFLAGLLPWWQAPSPTLVLTCAVLGSGGLLTALALAGPWRRSAFAPGLVISGVTALILAVDVMTGSSLQLNSLMGYTALVAGRFYGFGNQAFSLFAVAAVLTAAWLAAYPLRAGRKMLAVGVVALVGVAAVAVDGLPAWGADFGGVLAMVPTFAMLGMMVAGKRISPPKLGVFGLAGVGLVLLISYINAQSSNPTHLGRFWQDLMDGDAWGIIGRKFGAMLGSLGFWPFALVLAGAIGFLFFVLGRPARWRATMLVKAYEHGETMRPALICALTVAVIGTLVNDSGAVILSAAFILATPLALAAGLRSLELGLAAATERPARPEEQSAPAGSPPAERP